MAIDRIGDQAARRRFMESGAIGVALRRAHREIKMLRSMISKDQPTGTFHCQICFRDVPHSEDAHATDDHYLKHLDPEILKDINR